MHQRTAIRNALLTMLIGTGPSYATLAGTHVYAERTKTIPTNQLPAINFSFGEETATPREMAGQHYFRKFPLTIQVMVESATSVHDDADAICLQVETLLLANKSISGTISKAIYQGTTPEISSEGEKPLAVYTLNYEINYIT